MTAALCRFPTPPLYAAQLRAEACRREVVESAHAIIRGASRHPTEVVTDACEWLKAWADASDEFEAKLILEADAMLLAISLRKHRIRQVERPRPAIRLDDVALILGAVFAVGMFAYVVAL